MPTKAKYLSLSSRLRIYRKRSRFTQQKVADITGVSRSSISMYECGSVEPDMATLRKFAAAYNVSADVLLDIEKADIAFTKKAMKKELTAAKAALQKAADALTETEALIDKL